MSDPEYTWAEAQRLGGYRTILAVPMMREGSLMYRDDVHAGSRLLA